MDQVFRVEMLPALNGDCIWVEYGRRDALRRILVDGGPIGAYDALRARIGRVAPANRDFDLLVVTHIDADHIEAVIKLLNHPELGTHFDDVWFNGWPQLEKALPHASRVRVLRSGDRGPHHGEYLALRISDRGTPWNRWFYGHAIHIGPDASALPTLTLAGGMQVTLLGPTSAKLQKLRAAWHQAARRIGTQPGLADVYREKLEAAKRYRGGDVHHELRADLDAIASHLDPSVANGSSIALLLEYEGRRCALLGDAHADETAQALRAAAHAREERALRLDAIKVSHHGSEHNLSDGLLTAVDCTYYLFSSDGSRHGHPHTEAVSRVVRRAPRPPHLVFNYRSPQTAPWACPTRQKKLGYAATVPAEGEAGAIVDLLGGEVASGHTVTHVSAGRASREPTA